MTEWELDDAELDRLAEQAVQQERELCWRFARKVDAICALIVGSDYPAIDITLARHRLRREAEEDFPDRLWLYDMVIERRFDRLMAQFRPQEGGDR